MVFSATFPAAVPTQVARDHEAALVFDFARKVVKPGGNAFFIDQDNKKDGDWVSLEEAVRSGRAFAVEVADDMLAVDCDDAALVAQVLRLADELRLDGYDSVVVNSGEDRHLHLFNPIDDADLLGRYKARAREAGLDVRQAIRPPLAPHRFGLPVSLLFPDNAAEALAALSPRSKTRQMSPRMAALLRNGDREGCYNGSGKRSSVVMAIVTAMVNAGWTINVGFRALRDPKNRGGEKVQQRDERAARRYVEACWTKAQALVARHPAIRDRQAALDRINKVRVAVEAHAWKGTTGSTDRRVMEAHLKIAERTTKTVYGADVRTVAETAGCGLATVVKAHRRLRDQGWLKLVTGARWRESKATVWSLRVPPGVTKPNSPISTLPAAGAMNSNSLISPLGGDARDCSDSTRRSAERDCSVSLPAPAMDVWRRGGGLGGNAWRIYAALTADTSKSSKELAQRFGFSQHVVRRHLARLGRHGLAVRDAAWRWRKGESSPEDVAVKLGVAGKGDRQRLDHQRDRERHREALTHQETRVRI